MTVTLDRAKLLEELGFGHPDARSRAVDVLCAAGLTNPRKSGIAASKKARVRRALAEALILLCSRCLPSFAGATRLPVPTQDARHCEACGGSANRLALRRAADACRRGGVARVLVVGGAPSVHATLHEEWPPDLALRIVSGTERHTRQDAAAQLAWADVILVWSATQLDHAVSELYRRAAGRKIVVVRRRGIEALADALAARLDAR